MKRIPATGVLLLLSLLCCSACATAPVNMAEPRRLVGTESSVRIDAEVADQMAGSDVPITYVITNQRAEAIAIADIVPQTSWDGETRTVTVNIGAEIPGATMLPRLVRIGPGEKKTFSTTARFAGVIRTFTADPRAVNQALLRLKVNFLGDTKPFGELIDIPERAIADQARADALFTPWLERNEAVYTNAVPVRMTSNRPPPADSETRPPVPTRRGRRGGV